MDIFDLALGTCCALHNTLLDEDGQAMVEYGVIAAALLLGLVLAAKGLQIAMSKQLGQQHQALAGAP